MEHEFEKRFPADSKDYKLYEEVGDGVSATVYRALCIPLNEIVAIKVLDLEKCNNDLDGIRREVQTMSLIDHPNVLHALCSFTAGLNLWIVTPYMAGGSCLNIMKFAYIEGFEEPVIATLLREVLKALVYLHSQGHIHRDVKAGNILIDANGAVKLADFGVSACMFDTGDRQRSRNTFVGTPCWMAPEVMQQLHGYDFKADIWSFGITALELAHGHAPFSKYPPMKVLLMTLQNAPPGLDYERDKRFSKSFKEMIAACLVKDPKKRPTSEKLLKHHFFKHGRSNEYLARTILDGLPPLGDRYRTLKEKEANFLVHNKAISGDKDQLSQQEYIRGISGWNFNLDDLKAQATLIQSSNGISNSEDLDINHGIKDGYDYVDFPPPQPLSPERVSHVSAATSRVDGPMDFHDLKGSFASSFTARPLQALKDDKHQIQIYQRERNYSGPLLYHQVRDFHNHTPAMHEESSEGSVVQRKGRFKITSVDAGPKGSPSSNCLVNSMIGAPTNPTVNAASILPSLQLILQQNAMQREQLVKLIKCVERTSGLQTELSNVGTNDKPQLSLASSREKELESYVVHLQQRIGSLVEEVQRLKMKNAQLEQQLSALGNKGEESIQKEK